MGRKNSLDQLEQNVLLHTKLAIPPAHSFFVPRYRLTHQLEGASAGCVTLVSAPAGFGKTTLVGEWARQGNGRVAWLSLDEGDNDVVCFWRYIIAALQTVATSVGQHALPALPQFVSEAGERPLALLINELNMASTAADPITLVLDDYHLIHISAIHQSLSFFLYHLPQSLHVVILTRADPPLALARLRVLGRLAELRAADLQFTPAEMDAFFAHALDFELPTEAVATLGGRIEGWPAGLQLAALSLKGLPAGERELFIQAFSGAQRFILDYLLEEVLQQQPERIQTFLRQTAVLHHLTPALCTAVTGCEDAGQILARLADNNLFIVPLDEAGNWYRYHRLFADALRHYLAQTEPALISELRRRANAWYAEQGLGSDLSEMFDPLLEPLTERELETLALIARGLSNQEIADQLVISVGTVKGHINHLLSKLGARNRTEAVAHAHRLGLLKT